MAQQKEAHPVSGVGETPRKANTQRRNDETDPLLPPTNPPIPMPPRVDSKDRLAPAFKLSRRDRQNSIDGGGSVSSRASYASMKLLPWAFQNLSTNILPSSTEVVYETSDDDLGFESGDDDSISSDEPDGPNDRSNPDDNVIGGSRRSLYQSPPRARTPGKRNSQQNSSSTFSEYPPFRSHTTPKKKPHHHRVRVERSLRRRIHLLLTEPDTSIVSAIFFTLLIIMIFLSNIIMMMQTMQNYQVTPDDCKLCGGTGFHL
uniref:Uncharacterized protein n=1 Tax=Ditylum brightwellii TaxID=49249 RepID=A0A7S4R2T9_9STRA